VADLYYIEEGYYDAGYFVYTADAAADVSSTSSIFAVAGKNQSIDLVAFSNATLTATLNTIKEGASAVTSNATLTATAGKIVDVNDPYTYTWDDLSSWGNYFIDQWAPKGVVVVSQFTLTGNITEVTGVDVFGSGAWTSESSLSITGERLAGLASAHSASFAQTAQASITIQGASDLAVAFTQASTISHIEGADLFALSEAAISIAVDRLRDNNIEASAAFSVAADVVRIKALSGDESAEFSFSATADRSRLFASSQEAAFSLTADVSEIVQLAAAVTSNSTLEAAVGKIVDASSTLNAEVSVIAAIDGTLEGASQLSSAFTQTATISHIHGADLSAFSDASVSIAAAVTRTAISTQESTFTQTADNSRTRNVESSQSSEFTLIADNARTRNAQSSQSSAFTQTSAVDNRTRDQVGALTSAFTITATISHIRGADLTAFSESQVTTEAVVTRSAVSDQASAFALAATIDNRQRDQSASMACAVTVTATISHIEGADLVCESFATLTCEASDLDLALAALTSTASLSATASTTKGITQNLSVVATIFARPKRGITWVNANGVSLPTGGTGAGGAVINNSVFKYGSGSLEIPAGTTSGIVAALDANDHTIAEGASTYSISFWFRRAGSITAQTNIVHIGSSTYNLKFNVRSQGIAFTITRPGFADASFYHNENLASVFQENQWHFVELAAVQGNGVTQSSSKRYFALYINGTGYGVASFGAISSTSEFGIPVSNNQVFISGTAATTIYIDDYQYRVGAYYGTSVPTAQVTATSSTRTLLNLNGDFADTRFTTTFIVPVEPIYVRSAVTANVEKFKFVFAEASLASAFTQTSEVSRIKFLSADLSSAFAQTLDANRIRETASQQASEFTQSTEAVKTASIASALDSQAAFTATISHIHGADLVAFSDATMTATATAIKPFDSALASAFAQTADADRFRDFISAVNSEFTQTALAVKTADAASAVSSEFALTADNTRVRFADTALASEFTTAATAEANKPFDSNLTANTSVSATAVYTADADIATEAIAINLVAVVRIAGLLLDGTVTTALTARLDGTLEAASSVSSEFTQAAVNDTLRGFDSSISSAVSVSTTALRTQQLESAVSSSTSVVANATTANDIVLGLSSAAAVNADAAKLNGLNSELSVTATQTAAAKLISSLTGAFTSQVEQTASAVKTSDIESDIASAFAVTCAISHIEGADIVAEGFATLTVVVEAGKFGASNQSAAFTQTADAARFRGIDSGLSSQFDLSAGINEIVQLASAVNANTAVSADVAKTVSVFADQSAVFAVTATISHIEGADIVAEGFATLVAEGEVFASGAMSATSAVNFTATANKLRGFNANLAASTSLNANVSKFAGGLGTLQARATFQANAGRLGVATATITSAMTFVANVREIDLDSVNQVVYIIPREVWTYTIAQEIWTRTIPAETRIYTIKEE
jgi:hypothetical protein